MGKSSVFLSMLRDNILIPRFEALIDHGESYVLSTIEVISQRMAWYITNDIYKKKYGVGAEIDLTGDSSTQYNKFLKAIKGFCEGKRVIEQAKEVNPKFAEYWGLLRKALGIEAKGRAVMYGAVGDNIMVVPENKEKYIQGGLIACICEKETLGRKWLKEMNKRGWGQKFVLIITQGFSSCEVIETLMEIQDNINDSKTNFAVGVLHDLDISGIGILEDIRQYFDVMDFGINFDMLDEIDNDLWDQIKEPTKTTKEQEKYMTTNGFADVLKRLNSYKLELDNLFVVKKIDVFADYAEEIITTNCERYDLNRIGQPSYSYPEDLGVMREKIDELFDKICYAGSGMNFWESGWTRCATKRKDEMITENVNYQANVKEIKNAFTYIRKQSAELQAIVEKDPKNVERVKKVKALYELLNITALEELIDDQTEDDEEEDESDVEYDEDEE